MPILEFSGEPERAGEARRADSASDKNDRSVQQPAEKVSSCAKVQNIAKITLGWVVKISNFGCAKSFVMKFFVFVCAVQFTFSHLSASFIKIHVIQICFI